jgi:putative FmdB family regulatory protein
MPIYEYKCQNCGDLFEVRQRFSDEPVTVHEQCGGKVERQISVSALQFKGSGFYVNDYGKGNSKEAKPKTEKSNGTSSGSDSSNKSDSSSSGKSDSSSSGKSDSSSPAKSESSSKSDSSSKTDSSSSTASKPSASKTDSK